MANKILKFDVADAVIEPSSNYKQFATLYVKTFSSGLSRNKTYVSEEVLRSTAHTILEKPLIWAYDAKRHDASAHEPSAVPCGFVPSVNSLKFESTEDGRLMLTVAAKIWKYYSGYLMDFFERDGAQKPVSVEIEVIDADERPDGVLDIKDFNYAAISILGSKIRPAIPGAKAMVVNFAELNEKYEEAYRKEFQADPADSKILKEGDIIVEIEDEKVLDENSELGNFQELQPEQNKADAGSQPELEKEEDVAKEVEGTQKELPFAELRAYFSEKQEILNVFDGTSEDIILALFTEIKNRDEQIAQLDKSKAELQKFKDKSDAEELQKAIDETLNTVRSSLGADEIDLLSEKSKDYSLKNINIWRNEALAKAYEASVSKSNKPDDFKVAIPEREQSKKKSGFVWDK